MHYKTFGNPFFLDVKSVYQANERTPKPKSFDYYYYYYYYYYCFYSLSDADNAICGPKFTLLLSSFLPYSLLFLNFSFIFLIICHFMPQVTKSKSLCELD